MKKLSFLMAAIWALGLLFIPQTGMAKLIAMTDCDLDGITGQAGISFQASDVVAFNIKGDNFTYTNPDSVNEFGEPATIGMYDTILQGSVSSPNPIDIDFVTEKTSAGTNVQGISLAFKDVDVKIDKFMTDIRLGDQSLGLFGMMGFHAHISGSVRMFTRP